MKTIYLCTITMLLLLSCKKDNSSNSQTITKGEKWGIKIGSSPADVFVQLQQAGADKGFNDVAVVYRQAFSKPEQVQGLLKYYNALTLQTTQGQVDRVVIELDADKVTAINTGGALPAPAAKWPQNVADAIAIHQDDQIRDLYLKLTAIYQLPEYSGYQIILPDKPLNKPFDPDMSNYNEWAFTFTENVSSATSATSAVRLIFKDGHLNTIRIGYNESQVVN